MLLKIYDSPQSLVVLINATPEEESTIGEELGIMGCRRPGLRVVGYEIGSKDRYVLLLYVNLPPLSFKLRRQDLYRGGGIISVTSRILVVDAQGRHSDRINNWYACHACGKVNELVKPSFVRHHIHHSCMCAE